MISLLVVDVIVEVDEGGLDSPNDFNRKVERDWHDVLEPKRKEDKLVGALQCARNCERNLRKERICPSNQPIYPRIVVTLVVAVKPRCTQREILELQHGISDSADDGHDGDDS